MLPPFIHKFQTESNKYVYDINTNNVIEVSDIIYDIIDDYGMIPLPSIISKFHNKYNPEQLKIAYHSITTVKEEENIFSSLHSSQLKYPEDKTAIQHMVDADIFSITLNVTEQCNLRCRYCAYSGHYYQRRVHAPRFMSFDVARKAIDFLLSNSALRDKIGLSFYGGEPLLNKSLIIDCVKYMEFAGGPRNVDFQITTNGTLMDDEVIKLFIDHDFLVTVSLDGPKEIHDRNRVFRNGHGTYDSIVNNLNQLRKADPDFYESNVSFNITISPPYNLLASNEFISKSELIGRRTPISVSNVSGKDTTYFDQFNAEDLENKEYDELLDIYKLAAINNELNLSYPRRHFEFIRKYFDNSMVKICKRAPASNFETSFHPGGICVPGPTRTFVSVDGKIYPCEKCNHASDLLCVGSVDTGIDMNRVIELITEYSELTADECLSCWASRLCDICFIDAEKESMFDRKEKLKACESYRRGIHKDLILCYSILERNPHAFDFVKRIKVV